ncbi:MAG: hypothetical protein HOE45_07885 [Gammaproteobacteria bacterium]|jgi:hypothetical protein|nr:hypothetical protein [Gammaproteobacteria bacterium]MBT4146777.1 hypothetical protein [Gammaproteobacteria bacterium]MBT5223577.1 hypothetical protein [Gammaproteobacteria bacterium]MBT5826749.1 hypothetical protein [Gammaproteobacteria bacterium]MBT6419171.1 hypothetical protein [Gammaproteobacteria bacterium]
MILRGVLYLVLLIAVSACQNTPTKVSNLTDCPEVRPQVCAMIYAPVCAMGKNGRFTSYSSGCKACSHEEVVGYTPGVCTKEN